MASWALSLPLAYRHLTPSASTTMQHSLTQKISALVDLGGGDTTLRLLAVE